MASIPTTGAYQLDTMQASHLESAKIFLFSEFSENDYSDQYFQSSGPRILADGRVSTLAVRYDRTAGSLTEFWVRTKTTTICHPVRIFSVPILYTPTLQKSDDDHGHVVAPPAFLSIRMLRQAVIHDILADS